jgi:hypothetical protein
MIFTTHRGKSGNPAGVVVATGAECVIEATGEGVNGVDGSGPAAGGCGATNGPYGD